MGTRADFYIGRGETAEWLGSVAYDGYAIPSKLWEAKTADEFRACVKAMLEKRSDATVPADGWPWPWEDSNTTDYAYAFDETDGKVWSSNFGYGWHSKAEIDADKTAWEAFNNDETGEVPEPDDLWGEDKTCVFPNMKAKQNVTLGPRSGLMIFSTKR